MPSEPVSSIRGVGSDTAKKLSRLNIRTKLDLVLHLPHRYEDRSVLTPLNELRNSNGYYYVQGVVQDLVLKQGKGRSNAQVTLCDESGGVLTLRFFNYRPRWIAVFQKGVWVRAYGQLWGEHRHKSMIHPDFNTFSSDPGTPEPEFVPVYYATKGLTSKHIRSLIQKTIQEVNLLPKFAHFGMTLAEAIQCCHNPDVATDEESRRTPRRRIAFDELLAYYLLQQRRRLQHKTFTTRILDRKSRLIRDFIDSLGFQLTKSQANAAREILADMNSTRPMLRLLQGDVGSGKTAVATLCILRAAENGVQTAFMAPTELLAEQHYQTLSEWLDPLGIRVGLVTGRMPAPTRRARQKAIVSGDDLVVVGTHALFQDSIHFNCLGLTIIDEQQRFGVHQRMLLRDKGKLPHQLIMTATPIPRTLALYLFADMDVSRITELPPGRQSITTTLHSEKHRAAVIEAVRRHVERGQQAYWVCAAIAEAEKDEQELIGTEDVLKELAEKIPTVRVGHVHGQMKAQEKRSAMSEFRDGTVDVLVATTVIEVGVDVPDATLIVIDNASNMGLAQLHQLRGRVGRGAVASFCMLNYSSPLSDTQRQRLVHLRESQDGFKLADLDLQLRGWGEVFGTKQSGTENFRVASLADDRDLIDEVNKVGAQLITKEPELAGEIIDTWSPLESDYASV